MADLAEADMGLTNLAFQSGLEAGNPRYIGDDTLLVKFYLHPKKNVSKSAEAGRPIYEELEYISIRVPGGRNNIVRPARQTDKNRWPKHYAAFKAKDDDFLVGTPLDVWPAINRSLVEELKHFNVRTVEQLADLADSHAQNFMAIGKLKTRAKLFLEASKDSAVTERMQSELEIRDNEIETLKLAVTEQGAQIQALTEQVGSDPTSKRKPNTKSGSS